MSKTLRAELDGLLKNIRRTDDLMAQQADEFWANDGVCCPSCGVPGYSDLQLKQERREKRVAEVRAKIARDGPA